MNTSFLNDSGTVYVISAFECYLVHAPLLLPPPKSNGVRESVPAFSTTEYCTFFLFIYWII